MVGMAGVVRPPAARASASALPILMLLDGVSPPGGVAPPVTARNRPWASAWRIIGRRPMIFCGHPGRNHRFHVFPGLSSAKPWRNSPSDFLAVPTASEKRSRRPGPAAAAGGRARIQKFAGCPQSHQLRCSRPRPARAVGDIPFGNLPLRGKGGIGAGLSRVGAGGPAAPAGARRPFGAWPPVAWIMKWRRAGLPRAAASRPAADVGCRPAGQAEPRPAQAGKLGCCAAIAQVGAGRSRQKQVDDGPGRCGWARADGACGAGPRGPGPPADPSLEGVVSCLRVLVTGCLGCSSPAGQEGCSAEEAISPEEMIVMDACVGGGSGDRHFRPTALIADCRAGGAVSKLYQVVGLSGTVDILGTLSMLALSVLTLSILSSKDALAATPRCYAPALTIADAIPRSRR